MDDIYVFMHSLILTGKPIELKTKSFAISVLFIFKEKNMSNGNADDHLHRLPGTDDQEQGGLIIKKKSLAVSADDQHVFKVPQAPLVSTSTLGLDKLAKEKRRAQSNNSSPKRSKTSSDDDRTEFSRPTSYKDRHYREQRVETPASTRSSHHDYYEKSRLAAKPMHRGLVYGKDGDKQRRRHREKNDDDDERRFSTPNIRGERETPSRTSWDDDESDRRRNQWENGTPNDRHHHHQRQGNRRNRDTDYYNRKKNDTPLPTPSYLKSKHEDFDEDDRRNWEDDQKVK